MSSFLKSKKSKVSNSDSLTYTKAPVNIRTKGRYSTYTDPDTGEHHVYRFVEEKESGDSLYSLTKYGSLDAASFNVLDSVVTQDLMMLYIVPKNDISKRAVQFHLNNKA